MIIEMMDEKDEQSLDKTISFLKDCEHYKLQELYRTLVRWRPEIINYFLKVLTVKF
jgi:transposase